MRCLRRFEWSMRSPLATGLIRGSGTGSRAEQNLVPALRQNHDDLFPHFLGRNLDSATIQGYGSNSAI